MRRIFVFPILATIFLTSFVTILLLDWVRHDGTFFVSPTLARTTQSDQAYWDGLTPEEKINIRIYEQTSRSVVNINTQTRQNFFFQEAIAQGAGSGSVLDKQGHILTNYHVVAGANDVEVILFNGNSYKAKVIGCDPVNDTAVLKISAPQDELFPITFGNSGRLKVGQKVYAIGNPFGLDFTLSTGVVSSLNRQLPSQNRYRTIKQVIQIDAAINPGNSGGPLLDSHGEMIGMNTAIASRGGGSDGVGFAIPANTLARIIPQLIQHGRVLRPNLGIEQVMQTKEGLLITRVQSDGPAALAGLAAPRVVTQRRQQGPYVYQYQTMDRNSAQIITGINGEKVTTADDLLSVVESYRAGETVKLTILQGGKERIVSIVLGTDE